MREELAKLNGQRTVFRGTFQRYGIRPVMLPPVKTFCLADIQNADGIVLADHLWLSWRQRFATLGELQEGQVVEFVATVTEYEKRRYKGRPERQKDSGHGGTDYRLSYPANVRVIQ
jgi:hypothetical protein